MEARTETNASSLYKTLITHGQELFQSKMWILKFKRHFES